MSGIMAIVSLDGRPVPTELARKQLAAIAHRGEWAPRLWEAGGRRTGPSCQTAAHARSRPRSPSGKRCSTGRYWITWDGGLDNRHELAGLLGLDSPRKRRLTDADYVLAAYQRWGAECVRKLLGDWPSSSGTRANESCLREGPARLAPALLRRTRRPARRRLRAAAAVRRRVHAQRSEQRVRAALPRRCPPGAG